MVAKNESDNSMVALTKLVDVLVCPKCRKNVILTSNGKHLDCKVCNLSYPINDGIPVMLIDSAEKISYKE